MTLQPVTIYTARYCAHCANARELLRALGVLFDEVDLTDDDAGRERLVKVAGGHKTVPQIFVGITHVGGFRALEEKVRSGEFARLLGIGQENWSYAQGPG